MGGEDIKSIYEIHTFKLRNNIEANDRSLQLCTQEGKNEVQKKLKGMYAGLLRFQIKISHMIRIDTTLHSVNTSCGPCRRYCSLMGSLLGFALISH